MFQHVTKYRANVVSSSRKKCVCLKSLSLTSAQRIRGTGTFSYKVKFSLGDTVQAELSKFDRGLLDCNYLSTNINREGDQQDTLSIIL